VTTWRDFERAGWESHVDPYHQFFGPICAKLTDPLLDAVEAGRGSRLLDACCGPGYLAGRALERGAVVDGIDIAHTMIELARLLYPAARFQVGDCEEMRYPDDTFDAVVCNLGLHHLTSPARGVAEFARVLRPAGRLSLTVWDENQSALDIVPAAITAAGAIAPDDLPTPPNAPDYDSADELEPLFEAAGLALESVEPVTFLQPYPERTGALGRVVGGCHPNRPAPRGTTPTPTGHRASRFRRARRSLPRRRRCCLPASRVPRGYCGQHATVSAEHLRNRQPDLRADRS